MSDLLSKLKAGTRNVKLIDWPGSSTKVLLRILSQQDLEDAAFATERLYQSQKIAISMATAEEYESEKATQMLWLALRDPVNVDEPIAPNITEFRKLISREEKKALSDEYLAFEGECSPNLLTLSSEELDQLVRQVKKTPETTLSELSSIGTLRKLCQCLASQALSAPSVSS